MLHCETSLPASAESGIERGGSFSAGTGTGHPRYCGTGCSTYPTIWSLGKAVAIYQGMLELNLFFRSFPGPNMCLILINRIHLRGSITVLVPSNSNLCDLHNVKSFQFQFPNQSRSLKRQQHPFCSPKSLWSPCHGSRSN